MDNKTKIILTAIGLSAVVVPAIFLFFISSSKDAQQNTATDSGGRQINEANIEREVNSQQQQQQSVSPSPQATPTPTPTPSAKQGPATQESTQSSQ